MDIDLPKLKAFITSPEGRRFARKFMREEYPPAWSLCSPILIRTLAYAHEAVSRLKSVDSDDFHYHKDRDFGKLTAKAFSRLHTSLFERCKDQVVDDTAREDRGMFPYYYLDYRGLRFHLLIGQGSATWVTKTP